MSISVLNWYFFFVESLVLLSEDAERERECVSVCVGLFLGTGAGLFLALPLLMA